MGRNGSMRATTSAPSVDGAVCTAGGTALDLLTDSVLGYERQRPLHLQRLVVPRSARLHCRVRCAVETVEQAPRIRLVDLRLVGDDAEHVARREHALVDERAQHALELVGIPLRLSGDLELMVARHPHPPV